MTRADGRFVITGIAPGPHTVVVQLPEQSSTPPVALDFPGGSVILTVSGQNTLLIAMNQQAVQAESSNGNLAPLPPVAKSFPAKP